MRVDPPEDSDQSLESGHLNQGEKASFLLRLSWLIMGGRPYEDQSSRTTHQLEPGHPFWVIRIWNL